jgi:penicillin amidase
VADVGNWDACEWVIPAGQSGNPMSPHYDDQLPLWQQGKGITIPWAPEAVAEATVKTLKLVPKA